MALIGGFHKHLHETLISSCPTSQCSNDRIKSFDRGSQGVVEDCWILVVEIASSNAGTVEPVIFAVD